MDFYQEKGVYNSKRLGLKSRHHFSRTSLGSYSNQLDLNLTEFAPPFRRFSTFPPSDQYDISFDIYPNKSIKDRIFVFYKQWFTQNRLKDAILGYNIVNSSIEKQIHLSRDVISKLGWLGEHRNILKLRSRQYTSGVPVLSQLPRYSMVDIWAELCLVILGLSLISFKSFVFKKISIIFLTIFLILLTSRVIILVLWTRRINAWIKMFNQFIEIYLRMDQQTKKGVKSFQEFKSLSKNFRRFSQKSELFLPESDTEFFLSKLYSLLSQSQIKFDSAQTCLKEKFPDYFSSIRASYSKSKKDYHNTTIATLNTVTSQFEQCLQSRANYLASLFSLISKRYLQPIDMCHNIEFLQFTGQQLTNLSYSGNAQIVQILSISKSKSPHFSRSTSLSGITLDSEKSSLTEEEKSLENVKLKQIQVSLNKLEFEMRNLHTRFHLFNKSFWSRDVISSKVSIDQLEHITNNFNNIASNADAALQRLKDLSTPGFSSMPNSQPSSPELDSTFSVFEEELSNVYTINNFYNQESDRFKMMKFL